jgi:hypothetical protein
MAMARQTRGSVRRFDVGRVLVLNNPLALTAALFLRMIFSISACFLDSFSPSSITSFM